MKIYRFTYLILILILSSKSWAQYDDYVKLEKLYDSLNQTDSLLVTLQKHYLRAKLEKDSSEQLSVLTWLYWYNEDKGKDQPLKDSLISLVINLEDPREESRVYYTFASKEFERGDFSSSIQNLEKSIQIALNYFEYEQALESVKAFNSLLIESNQYEKALSNLDYLSWSISKTKEINLENKLDLENRISIEKTSLFINTGLIDSSSYYLKALSKDLSKFDNHDLGRFKLMEATLNFRNQFYLNARDSLQKYLSTLDKTQIKDAWYILSLVERKLNNSEYSDNYLKLIDSALESERYPQYNNGVSTYKRLLSIAPDSLKNKYLGLFYHYEKNTNRNYESITKASLSNRPLTPLIVVSIIAIIFILIFWLYKSSLRKTNLNSKHKIVEETNFNFRKKLEKWENDKEFINPSTTLASLAVLLETNTSYLSRYFNQELQVSFSNYLSKLRINHLLDLIQSNPSIIKSKSSIQIAESLGFKSIDAYYRAFKITTGSTPNQYLKKVITGE